MDDIVEIIHDVFNTTGHEWKFSDGYRIPERSEIKAMLKKASEIGESEFFESGGLFVENTGENIVDVYVYIGTVDLDTGDQVG